MRGADMRLVLKTLVLLCAVTVCMYGYRGGPPPGHTGGFEEPTCNNCHEFPAGDGAFAIMGVPETYNPGEVYPITIQISQPFQMRWGFQLAVRFMADGTQAGVLEATDVVNTQIMTSETGIQYISHTYDGVWDAILDGPVMWTFNWTAPLDPTLGAVQFNAVGNAADGLDDPSGDYIYSALASSTYVPPCPPEDCPPCPPEDCPPPCPPEECPPCPPEECPPPDPGS